MGPVLPGPGKGQDGTSVYPWGLGTEAREPSWISGGRSPGCPEGSRATIPALSGPTLTWVLIPSVDPKLKNCGGMGEEKGRKGVSKSPAWQAGVSCSCCWDHVPSPLTHPESAGCGWAGSRLPSRAFCLLPASTALKARAALGLGARQRVGGRRPCPRLHLPPHQPCPPILAVLAFVPCLLFSVHPVLHTPFCATSPQSPPWHTNL